MIKTHHKMIMMCLLLFLLAIIMMPVHAQEEVEEVEKVIFKDSEGQTVETTEATVVEYQNNMKMGKANVVLSIEGYEGTTIIEDAFEIMLGNVTSLKAAPVTYNKIKAYSIVDGKKVFSEYTDVVKQKAQLTKAKITSAKRNSYQAITIRWKSVYGANGYSIYRFNSKNGTYERIATVKGNDSLVYKNEKRVCGKTYYYKVAAYRIKDSKKHYGEKSVAVSARTTPAGTAFTTIPRFKNCRL